jgi:7-carboxy-7-deazaguanine synthase
MKAVELVMALIVNELFFSIQGESSYAGFPCVFVRLTGCNLRCTYCDTTYAYYEGHPMTLDQIIGDVAVYACPLVEITGGEPLMQNDTPELAKRLLAAGYTVLIETNGSQDISVIDHRCIKIVDFKCPSSGIEEKNDLRNLDRLSPHDEIKFVIGNKSDYLFAKRLYREIRSRRQDTMVHFSPVFEKLSPRILAEWILDDRLDARLAIQLHKIIWPSGVTGV